MSNQNLWIFSLEPLENRYTEQWHKTLPELLRDALPEFNVVQIDGIQKNNQTLNSDFLNFSDTNYWKSTQLQKFLDFHNQGKTTPNDYFLFTDFWNPAIIQLKYIASLTRLSWTFGGMVHAGNYDKNDILGQLISDAQWVKHAEKSFFHCFDNNFFATDYHIQMFTDNLFGPWYDSENEWMGEEYSRLGWINENLATKKFVRTGWPFETLDEEIQNDIKGCKKRDLILFPHRISPEKQPEIFKDLQKELPKYEFVMCQEKRLSKREYHRLLGESKIVFSASLQETLGISSGLETLSAGAIPIVPDRLSYTEMFSDPFKYKSKWTENFKSYTRHKSYLKMMINDVINNFEDWEKHIPSQKEFLKSNFFNASEMINTIKTYVI